MYKKVTIGKGSSKKKVPANYIPKTLSKKDKEKQEKSILEKKKRPKVDSFESKRSSWVEKFEKKYGKKITNKKFIYENILKKEGVEQVISKGMAAYFNSGSRPNQTAFSWSSARLASVILNGPARKIDKKIWEKYKIKN